MSVDTRKVSITGVGSSDAIAIYPVNDIRAIILCEVTGTVTYTIEYSLDGEFFFTLNGNAGLSAHADATVVMPVRSVRVKVTAGSGTVTMRVRQTDGKFGS